LGGGLGGWAPNACSRGGRVYRASCLPHAIRQLFVAVDLSLRASGYTDHVKLINAALWDQSGQEVMVTKLQGNCTYLHLSRATCGAFCEPLLALTPSY
jgi:hypothetical protein